MICGLEAPTTGSVRYHGVDVKGLRGKERLGFRRAVQLVLQDPYASLDPRMKVGDAVEEPLLVHRVGRSRSERRSKVAQLLESVGLGRPFMHRYPHQLSGGQRQRVSIARALALEPDVIVLDEPVSALDLSVQAQLLNLLVELKASRPQSYLLISHDLGVVRHLADDVAVMYLGRIVEYGPKSEVFARPAHPYTVALLSAAPGLPGRQRAERIVLRGELPNPAEGPPRGCPFRTRCWMAQDVCAEVGPSLTDVTPSHVAACHFSTSLAATSRESA